MKDPQVIHAKPYRSGGDLFRVIMYQYDESEKLMWEYEIWGTLEAIEDTLHISHYPSASDLYKFGAGIYKKRMDEIGYKPEQFEGAFAITADKIVYGDYRTFPGSVKDNDTYLHTNISLPKSVHEWLRLEGARNNDSLSETIRKAVISYKNRFFTCDTCGEVKQGDPAIANDCYDCFLKAFEETNSR